MVRKNSNDTDTLTEVMLRSAETMSSEARERVRTRVTRDVGRGSRMRPAAIMSHRLAVAATAFAVLTGGVAYAAERSMPGDPLYQLKRGAETILVAVLPPGDLENGLLIRLAERRAAEAARLASEGATDATVDEAVDQLRQALHDATSAEGPLGEDDLQRIREHSADAPYPARKAIDDVVATSSGGSDAAPATEGGGHSGPSGSTGTGADTPKQDPAPSQGSTGGSHDGGQDSGPSTSPGPSCETSGPAAGR
jgi:hypothetical protein